MRQRRRARGRRLARDEPGAGGRPERAGARRGGRKCPSPSAAPTLQTPRRPAALNGLAEAPAVAAQAWPGALGGRLRLSSKPHVGVHSSVVEHSPYKRGVTGSNPVAPTRFVRDLGTVVGRLDELKKALEAEVRSLDSQPDGKVASADRVSRPDVARRKARNSLSRALFAPRSRAWLLESGQSLGRSSGPGLLPTIGQTARTCRCWSDPGWPC
jgi:hypothetical protein